MVSLIPSPSRKWALRPLLLPPPLSLLYLLPRLWLLPPPLPRLPPMPGTILEVRVTEGATVKKGDILLILEAMKMENEIMAPCDGTIKQVVAAKGASVNSGDPLIVIG